MSGIFFIFSFDFRKINGRTKNFEKYTFAAKRPMAAGVLASVGHGGRGAANGRLTC
jgi:hypothetical protein